VASLLASPNPISVLLLILLNCLLAPTRRLRIEAALFQQRAPIAHYLLLNFNLFPKFKQTSNSQKNDLPNTLNIKERILQAEELKLASHFVFVYVNGVD
jgi:hypothetical protein